MSKSDGVHWDDRYRDGGMAPVGESGPPPVFADFDHLIPNEGLALELACGRGRGAVWLASHGLDYLGVDVSPVAIELAERLVEREAVADRCRFMVHDLDEGLPPGEECDLILSYLFRDPALDQSIIERLRSGAILMTAVLSEVGGGPGGRFRAKPGELQNAFDVLEVLEHGEADGMAWLIGRKP